MKFKIQYIFCILLVMTGNIILAQTVNKPDEVFQPAPPIIYSGWSIPNYNSVNTNSSIFNYQRTYIPRLQITDINSSTSLSNIKVNTTYYNGMGKPIENIEILNIGGDLITPIDQRASLTKLGFRPYSVAAPGGFQTNPFNSQINFFNSSTSPYNIEDGYSFSANKTVVNTNDNIIYNYSYNPGLSFIGSSRATTSYALFNGGGDGNVPIWGLNSSGEPVTYGAYNHNEITIKRTEGQHNTEVKEYYDKDNKLICKMVKQGSDWLETWYVYNELSKLVWIITPKAVSYTYGIINAPTTAMLNTLCHHYVYNTRGHIIEKKSPDQDGSQKIVYDYLHRPCLVQTPLMAVNHQWRFMIYDSKDRVVMTGVFTDPENLSRDDIEGRVNNIGNWPGTVTFQPIFTYLWYGYTGSFPSTLSNCEIYQCIWYDRYQDLPSPLAGRLPYNYSSSEFLTGMIMTYPEMDTGMVRGLPVASKTRVFDPLNNNLWIYAINFYDWRGRLIQVQSKNPWNTGDNWDMITNQYDFNGNKVIDINQHYSWTGANKASTKIVTRYYYNYTTGKLFHVQQNVDNTGLMNIAWYDFDNLGRVKEKVMGSVEQQVYKYGIRDELTGINADYVYNCLANNLRTFGEMICYDYGFNTKRYDGSIAGYIWRGNGIDARPRAYGYGYDDAGRMLKADFNQRWHPNGPLAPPGTTIWTNADVDYSVADITYDANGNMGAMKEMGMAAVTSGSSTTIQPVQVDNLSYTYTSNTNKLAKVDDPASYHTNDFLDGTNTGNDYEYDADGNLTLDNNKGLALTYNLFDLPLSVTKGSTGTINNIYDGAGNLLQKTVVDGSTTDVYRYWGPFVYKNNKLQHFIHQEGRSRWLEDSSFFKNEFFVKDHLDNVRSIVAQDVSYGMDQYHAGFEVNYANAEASIFERINEVRDNSPSGTPGDLMSGKLLGSVDSMRIGAALLIHAMAGDQITLSAYGYYESDDTDSYNTYAPAEDMLNALTNTITNGTSGYQSEGNNIPGINPTSISALLSPANYNLYDAIKADATDPNYPRTYLNYLVFNEQMELIPERCQVVQIRGASNGWRSLALSPNTLVSENSFILMYLSNESDAEVYIDNEHIINIKGRILQEQHYYPHGRLMEDPVVAGSTFPVNKYLYQTKELQQELGMELHDFHARQYDAQLGRFSGVDPMDEFPSGYTGMGNDPANNIDPTGMMVRGASYISTLDGNGGESANEEARYSGIYGWKNSYLVEFEMPGPMINLGTGGGGGMEYFDDLGGSSILSKLMKKSIVGWGAGGGGGQQSKGLLDKFIDGLKSLFGINTDGGATAEEQIKFAKNREALGGVNSDIKEGTAKLYNGGQYVPGLGTVMDVTGGLTGTDPSGKSRSSGEMFASAGLGLALDVGGGVGFKSFRMFKRAMGSAGEGMAWHHIVEQTPGNISRFGSEVIHSIDNLVKVPNGAGSIHAKISGHYSSKRWFTNDMTVRQWLSTKSYQQQYNYGILQLKRYGIKK